MPAAFEGSSFLVTYPQSDFPLQPFLDWAKSLPSIKFLLVSSELHQDNSLHRHALFYFSSRQRLAARAFDYLERHPNVQPVGKRRVDWDNVVSYIKKDGEWLDWGTPRHTTNIWSQIACCTSREEAQTLLLSEKPRDAILNARNFDYWLDKVFPMQTPTSFQPRPFESFILPDPLQDWLNENFWCVHFHKCPILTVEPLP